ncbi:MAG: hypothetical protein DHS20C14_05960 [Phycisphaeraceae bacterium]|nr:MAG: hypothetical protein DHS20C14_05960 [Phycisphaeraceae bacterium]
MAAGAVGSSVAIASPFASSVVSYDAGSNPDGSPNDGTQALGAPTADNGFGTVTPFNPAFDSADVVSVGFGGHLTVAFDHRVENDALNPFGVDLLIFANEGFVDQDFPNGFTGDTTLFRELFSPEAAATIEVSQDGVDWHFVTTSYIDLWPTLATPGADFTRPVDPTLTIDDFDNSFLSGIESLYGGSGGGFGIDLDDVALDWIQYVRLTNEDDSLFAFEVDAFSDVAAVPAPSTLLPASLFVLAFSSRRRR